MEEQEQPDQLDLQEIKEKWVHQVQMELDPLDQPDTQDRLESWEIEDPLENL